VARIFEIPLIGGINTVTDLEDVSTGFVDLINLTGNTNQKYKNRGKFQEWQGFGTETTLTLPTNAGNEIVNNIQYWIAPDTGTQFFLIYDANSKQVRLLSSVFTLFNTGSASVLYNYASGGLGDANGLVFTNSTATDIQIYNNGKVVRFANGLSDEPIILMDSSDTRALFASNEAVNNGFLVDYPQPRLLASNLVTSTSYNSGWFSIPVDGIQTDSHNLSAKVYYYKYSLIWDGVQESPLDAITLGDTGGTTSTTAVPYVGITFAVGTGSVDFNARITGINIYRADSVNGAYFKIGSASTLYDDPNITTVSDASNQNAFYLDGDAIDDALVNSGVIVANMFDTYHGLTTGQEPNAQREYDILNNSDNMIYLDSAVSSLNDTCWRINGANETYTTTNGTDPGNTTPHAYVRYDTGVISALATEPTIGSSHAFNTAGGSAWSFLGSVGTHSSSSGIEESSSGTAKLTTNQVGSGATSPYAEQTLTLTQNKKYVLQAYITQLTTGDEVKIGIGTTTGANLAFNVAELVNMTGLDNSLPHGLALNGKRYFQITFDSGSVTTCYLQIRLAKASSGHASLYLDKLRVYQLYADLTEHTFFGGKDVIVSKTLGLGNEDSHKGHIYQMGSIGVSTAERGWIKSSARKAIHSYHGGSFPYNLESAGNSKKLLINDNYLWRKNGTNQTIDFYDKGLINGTSHPFGETINEVNFKYAVIHNGRQFVAGVKLDPSGEAEIHKDWVLFSELNQLDNIPIINYIQLNDLQGGEITGIAKVLNDIVVFMERGVFRLSVPSYNPTEWSLSEAYENVGCSAPKSIVQYNGGVFFLAEDNYYFIDANFNLTPVGSPIQNIVASFGNDTEAYIDIEYDRLVLIENPADKQTHYIFDLKENTWKQEKWEQDKNGNQVYGGNYFTDKDNETRFISRTTTGGNIRLLNAQGGVLDMNINTFGNGQGGELKTGLIRIADSGENKIIRRLNLRVGQPSSSIDITIYNEAGTSIYSNSQYEIPSSGNTSIRIGVRAELVQIKLQFRADGDGVIERMSLEVD